MRTRIVKVGNSHGIILTKSLLQQYGLKEEVEIHPQKEGLLITPASKKARIGWDEQFKEAIKQGHQLEGELLEGFSNEFDQQEWQW